MKKRFLALAMVLIFCVGLMSMAALAADEGAVTAEETIEEIAVEVAEEEDVVAEEEAAPVTDGADDVVTVDGVGYSDFDAAMNSAGSGSTVIMQSSISHSSNPCGVRGTVTLDLNGCTITGPGMRALFQLDSPAVLTINDSSADGSGTITKFGRTFRLNQGVTIIINGGNYTDTGSSGGQMGPLSVEGTGVTVEINGGTFSGNYYDSYVESNGSATYTLANSLAGFRVNVANGGSATLNGIWTDASGTEYTDATVSTSGTYTFVQNVAAEESDEDAGETDEDVDDDADTDDETVDDDTSVDTGDETGGDTSEDTAEEVTGTLASVSVSGYMTFDSVTITVDGVEYELEEDVHYTYVSEGDGPNAVLTFYFTDELVSALPAGTYTVTITGDQGPNGTVATDVDLVIDEDTVGGTADDAVSGDTESSGTEGGDTGSSDTGSSDTGSSDTGSSDTGSSDTGSSDTGSSDTGSSDTGSSDTGSSGSGSSSSGSGSSSSGSGSGSSGSGSGSDSSGSGSGSSGSSSGGSGSGSDSSGSGSGGSGSGSGSTGSDSDSDFDLSGILDSMAGSGSGSGSGGSGGSGSSMSDILSGLTDGDYSSWGSSGSNSSASGESDSSASDEVATPQTGDNSHMAIWCVLLALCGVALIGTSVVLRKRDNG